jgi:hypothetical protein
MVERVADLSAGLVVGRLRGAGVWLLAMPPVGEELQSLMEFTRNICIQRASALDLHGHLLWPPGGATDPGTAASRRAGRYRSLQQIS